MVIPTNSWHKHTNASAPEPARQPSFRNTTYITKVLHGGLAMYQSKEGVYHQDARFYDRFADEPDYFISRVELTPNQVQVNYVSDVVNQPLPAQDSALGENVAMQHFEMGGQRTLDIAVVAMDAGGFLRPYRPLAEEGLLVIKGTGRTTIWTENGPCRAGRAETGPPKSFAVSKEAWPPVKAYFRLHNRRLAVAASLESTRTLDGRRQRYHNRLQQSPVRREFG